MLKTIFIRLLILFISAEHNLKSLDDRILLAILYTFQVALAVKKLLDNAGDARDRFSPWVGKIPWRKAWQLIPVFLPGESYGERNLADYSP